METDELQEQAEDIEEGHEEVGTEETENDDFIGDYDDMEDLFDEDALDAAELEGEPDEDNFDPEDDDEAIAEKLDDDEDPTEEDLEDEEERSVLDDLLGQDPNAEDPDAEAEEENFDDMEITDKVIADAMYIDPDYGDYLKQAEDDGHEVKDNFAAMLARNRIDPKFVAERGLYNLGDFMNYISTMEEKTSPDAVYVPREDDEEGWAEFETNYLGVPKSPEEYGEDTFEWDFLKDKQEDIQNLRDYFYSIRLNDDQAYSIANFLNTEHDAFRRQAEEEEIQYKKTNMERLKDTFGKDFVDVRKDINTFIHKFGPDFLKEFKNSKVLSSETFVRMLYNAMNDVSSPTGIRFKGHHAKLSIISDEKLDREYNKLIEHKYADESYLTHKNASVRKIAKRVALKLRAFDAEMERRGLD